MKLYTEEQVREAFDNGYKYASTLRPTALEEHYRYVENSIKSLKPIELPSDQEISQNAPTIPKDADDYLISNKIGFVHGAKWMKEKILKQNK